ncbi:MFS transporter [Fluoribacter dumoffii]|uniref:MFS transporter n=1 Tax=Fluoribacter dumoffii TaxID=463 RepID=UPI002242DE2D|nr:MFS transporter [Fluoribacter dumoffii]MCW8419426.1 MFS transporter [Fluoribacter dumoffii]MCW8452699.1 MFS transporter [Fluoribacter dumoffii]MCW8460051.1 MFS transporter [Fluoribacter dumoffii]MCW8483529.1 MFS transporter [Fluoribacter dumoffii]
MGKVHELKLCPNERKVIFLASLGGALEFYDFIIYVIFAPIISQIFFPKTDKLASLMSVYAVFAIGYLIRPLGGIAFSHFGDKYGRKKTFIFSVILMAVPTVIIGFLPTYQHIGIWSSILLIFLRLLQGLSIGGEIPGALTFTCEHVNPRARGLACGVIFSLLNLGIFLGALISLILTSQLSNDQLSSFGWRIPFIFGGLLGIFSFYIRKRLAESPLFLAFKSSAENNRMPFIEAVTLHWRKILQGIGLTCLGAVMINLLFLYMPTYLSTILVYPKQQATLFNTLNLGFYSLLLIFFCWSGDRIGRKLILLIGVVGFIILSYFLFILLSWQTTFSLITALAIFAILSSSIMVYPSLLVDLFPVSIRYTGIAISYNLAFAFFGGLTPFIATYLVESLNTKLAPSFYLVFSALLCFVALLSLKKLYRETEVS